MSIVNRIINFSVKIVLYKDGVLLANTSQYLMLSEGLQEIRDYPCALFVNNLEQFPKYIIGIEHCGGTREDLRPGRSSPRAPSSL